MESTVYFVFFFYKVRIMKMPNSGWLRYNA